MLCLISVQTVVFYSWLVFFSITTSQKSVSFSLPLNLLSCGCHFFRPSQTSKNKMKRRNFCVFILSVRTQQLPKSKWKLMPSAHIACPSQKSPQTLPACSHGSLFRYVRFSVIIQIKQSLHSTCVWYMYM